MYKSLLFTNRIEDYYLQIEYKVQNYGKKLIDLSRIEHRILSKAQKLACSSLRDARIRSEISLLILATIFADDKTELRKVARFLACQIQYSTVALR